MSNVRIEKMKESDLEEVAKIFCTVFNEEGENWTEESSKSHVVQNYFGEAHFVAKENNNIIGMIMGIPLTRELGTEILIDSLVVLREYRGKGIGKKLFSKILEYAKKEKYKGVRFLANPEFNSFKWYKKMKYKESGWVELFKEIE